MVSLSRGKLGFLESNSMRLHDIRGGVLNSDLDVGELHKDYADSQYKFLYDLSSNRCESEYSIFHLNCQGLGSSYDFLNKLCLQTAPRLLAST
jgi:hypothetical protein